MPNPVSSKYLRQTFKPKPFSKDEKKRLVESLYYVDSLYGSRPPTKKEVKGYKEFKKHGTEFFDVKIKKQPKFVYNQKTKDVHGPTYGIYNPNKNEIYLKDPGNIYTLSHELAHASQYRKTDKIDFVKKDEIERQAIHFTNRTYKRNISIPDDVSNKEFFENIDKMKSQRRSPKAETIESGMKYTFGE